jgi:hypothetical protein
MVITMDLHKHSFMQWLRDEENRTCLDDPYCPLLIERAYWHCLSVMLA